MSIRFGMKTRPIPVLAPADITETTTPTQFVKLHKSHWITFLLLVGNLAGDSVSITVEASETGVDSDTETALAFQYRKSDAVGTDSLGDVATATAAGISLDPAADDNKLLIIDVDPAAVQAAAPNAKWVRVNISPNSSSTTNCVVSALAVVEPRYPSATESSDT